MANAQDSEVLSAQVILKPEAVSAAAATGQVFERAGFVIGRLVGNNFSITGPKSLFDQVFGTTLTVKHPNAVSRVTVESASIPELPLHALEPEVRDKLLAVAFTSYEPFR